MKTVNRTYFANARVGLFTHYTYATYTQPKNYGGTQYSQSDVRRASSAEEAAAMFDGEKFAKTAYRLGAEYVVFTVCHAGFNLLYPSEVMKAILPKKCTESSDVVRKLIDGLSKYEIPLVLYMPPNDECDLTEEEQKAMGIYQSPEGKARFIKSIVDEIFKRYGNKIAGFWFDQAGPAREVCDHVRECNPDGVVFINTGKTANEIKHPNSDFLVSEYYGSIESCDSDTLPVHYSQVNRQIGNWWAQGGKAPTDARNLYRYTVRTIAVEGQYNCGIAWSCGPYIDQTWEEGVHGLLCELGDMLRAHEGIYGTVPGRSYIEKPNAVLESDMWGVSTESPDGMTVYLHILNRPVNGVLSLPRAADGKVFREAWYKDEKLAFSVSEDGYTVTLPSADDGIDTVVRLEKL